MGTTPDRTPGPTRYPRLCVSAASGGGGKTLLALGLARAARKAGLAVKPFKKGPDYIDAAWLGRAAGMAATNLDPFFLPPAALAALFARALNALDAVDAAVTRDAAGAAAPDRAAQGRGRLGLVEGNRGLYDGLDAQGSCSTAGLARALACPVLLSLDATKMTRTAAALLAGLMDFEPGVRICGVVFNRVGSPRHETALRRAVEARLPLPVLGALPRLARNPLPERHMGIASSGAGLRAEADALLDALAQLVRDHVDVERVLEAAGNAPPLPGGETAPRDGSGDDGPRRTLAEELRPPPSSSAPGPHAPPAVADRPEQRVCPAPGGAPAGGVPAAPRPRIGYVRDAAFWFYYPENLAALEDAGAEPVPLALVDAPGAEDDVWETLDGLYLGGGFPEDFLPRLSGSPGLARLAALSRAGLPIYAECGGLLALSRGMERDGVFWPLAGALPLRAVWTARPQGLGYVEGEVMLPNPFLPVGLRVRAHEFHYSRCIREAGAPPAALALTRGTGMGRFSEGDGRARAGDGIVCGRTWGAYCHIFAPAVPCWAPNFVAAARARRAARALR